MYHKKHFMTETKADDLSSDRLLEAVRFEVKRAVVQRMEQKGESKQVVRAAAKTLTDMPSALIRAMIMPHLSAADQSAAFTANQLLIKVGQEFQPTTFLIDDKTMNKKFDHSVRLLRESLGTSVRMLNIRLADDQVLGLNEQDIERILAGFHKLEEVDFRSTASQLLGAGPVGRWSTVLLTKMPRLRRLSIAAAHGLGPGVEKYLLKNVREAKTFASSLESLVIRGPALPFDRPELFRWLATTMSATLETLHIDTLLLHDFVTTRLAQQCPKLVDLMVNRPDAKAFAPRGDWPPGTWSKTWGVRAWRRLHVNHKFNTGDLANVAGPALVSLDVDVAMTETAQDVFDAVVALVSVSPKLQHLSLNIDMPHGLYYFGTRDGNFSQGQLMQAIRESKHSSLLETVTLTHLRMPMHVDKALKPILDIVLSKMPVPLNADAVHVNEGGFWVIPNRIRNDHSVVVNARTLEMSNVAGGPWVKFDGTDRSISKAMNGRPRRPVDDVLDFIRNTPSLNRVFDIDSVRVPKEADSAVVVHVRGRENSYQDALVVYPDKRMRLGANVEENVLVPFDGTVASIEKAMGRKL